MNSNLKRALCLLLSLVLLLQAAPVTQVKAQAVQVSLPEVQIGEDILANDLFYLASTSATLREGANETYLLRVGRGGGAETESSVLIKISDMTAQYGKDYTVSVPDGSAKVVVPENNCSLMDLIAGQSFELTELKDEEDAEAIFAEDEDGMAAAEAGVLEALNYLTERSGVDFDADALDPVQQARNLYTGVEGSSQRVTATEDMFQQIQDIADVMTEVVPGAGVVLTYAPGETEKLLEITVKDNHESDGDRMFFLILSETEGTTTNSAASSCAFTIADDEEAVLSVISFSAETYSEIEDGMVTVTLHREGALNSVVSARVKTVGGTAEAGRDYSEVNREIVFPFGVSDMPLQIPVSTSAFDGKADVTLALSEGTGCTVSERNATVILTGTAAVQATAEPTPALRATEEVQSLTRVQTFNPINLSNPTYTGSGSSGFTGHNQYSGGHWEMDWQDDSGILYYNRFPYLNVTWKLSEDPDPVWIAGARVTWGTTGNHDNHHADLSIRVTNDYTKATNYNPTYYNSTYHSAQSFGNTTVDFYPRSENRSSPLKYLGLAYQGGSKCDNCNWVWVYSIEPIKRPFLVSLAPVGNMSFLKEDGSYVADEKDAAVRADLRDSVNDSTVAFLDDSVFVTVPADETVTRFLRFAGLEYVPADKPENAIEILTSSDKSASELMLKLTKENLVQMFRTAGSRFEKNEQVWQTISQGPNKAFYQNDSSDQVPTYGILQLRPKFEYINANVTLQNIYEFPVCFTISGTDYWVGPMDSLELQGIHLGDTLAVSNISFSAGYADDYVATGVKLYWKKNVTDADYEDISKYFTNGKTIYLGGAGNRLDFQDVVIQPELTQLNNQVVVKVKTADLSQFETIGLLAQEGTVNGQYTEFVFAAPGQTINGKVYPISVVPKSDNTVCVWTTYTGTSYVGDCFLFQAGHADSASENTVTLSTANAYTEMSLGGTLTFQDFNLRTGVTGTASSRPAEGAIVVAGNMVGIADNTGAIHSNTMKVPTSPQRYKVRCMITVNGSSIIRDVTLPIPARSKVVNLSQTFDSGVSAVMSPIFKNENTKVTVPGLANFSGLVPLGDIDESFTVRTSVKPVRYTAERADGNGSFYSSYYYEKAVSVQLVVLDQTGQERYKFAPVTESVYNSTTGEYTFTQEVPFEVVLHVPEGVAKPVLGKDYVEPGNGVDAAYRWIAKQDGSITVSGEYVKFANSDDPSADGTSFRIFLNGNEKLSRDTETKGNFAEDRTTSFSLTMNVNAGDELLFAVDPEGNDNLDGGRLSVQITGEGENNTVLADDFSDEQGRNGWHYGICASHGANFVRLTGFDEENQRFYSDGDDVTLYHALPGDRIYVRLTTDLLAQAEDLELPPDQMAELEALLEDVDLSVDPDAIRNYHVSEYTYSNVNTGYTIYIPNTYVEPIVQGMDAMDELTFGSLPLLGDVGMNLQFPFVNVGWKRLSTGYRMYIGVSPMQIIDKIKNSTTNRFKGDDGTDWSQLFAIAHPFATWGEGLQASWNQAFKNIGEDFGENGTRDVAELGASQWRFDFTLGMYFDFTNPTVTDKYGIQTSTFRLSGMGGYVSATVGFKTAWYTIIPVVFIPAYIGLTIEARIMGFFGAHADTDKPEYTTYKDAITVPKLDFKSDFNDEFHWSLDVSGMFQLSLGVGLCGTIGVRLVGQVDVLVNYEDENLPEVRDWGAYLTFKGGGMVDLFLFSVPLMYNFAGLKFGKFADFENQDANANSGSNAERLQQTAFLLRSGAEEGSEWLGNSTAKRGAFTPKQTYTLVENSYERADAQLITLRDGTVVLAYLSNDPDKGAYQRTTLMLTTYKNGTWAVPVAVSNDGTADFQPSIAETSDGRVLIAWASTEANDITDETTTGEYLRSMEIFAAFAEVNTDGSITVGETARISHDRRAQAGQDAHYYDANPTVVCDTESGDAIIYYIKSGSATEDVGELANPYVNDSVICYLPYDRAKDKWMTDEFYDDEIYGETPEDVAANEQFLIDNFCGQRFLDAPTFETADGGREYYSIPDFTAIGYDGMAIYAYTVDRDSSNDTETDKEMFLQVYSFRDHYTYYQIRLTEDVLADALPQLIRTEQEVDGERVMSTKLFWYRGGQGVCYIDVSDLLDNGINPDGSLKLKPDGSTNTVTPILVDSIRQSEQQANQMADFHVAQDENGSIYVIWTDAVAGADGLLSAQEIFAVSQYVDPENELGISWSKPYQLTNTGLQNDEITLTLMGSELLLVHNQYQTELTEDAENPLAISDMRLVATTLEPCGSVKARNLTLLEPAAENAEEGALVPAQLPQPGQTVTVEFEISNDGLTPAEGYHVDVYQISGERQKKVYSLDQDTRLRPNSTETLSFQWTIPSSPKGTYLQVEATENRYSDRTVYRSEPLELRADYALTSVGSYQAEDGFHLTGVLTNIGNAATASGEKLLVRLTGPYNLDQEYTTAERILYLDQIETLGVGESGRFDVLLNVSAGMLERDRYITFSAEVAKEITISDLSGNPVTDYESLSNDEHVECFLTRPMSFTLNGGEPIALAVEQTKDLTASMELGELLGGENVTFSVADVNIARIENGKLLGVAEGETTVYATHVATGTTVSVPVRVSGEAPIEPPQPKENPFTDVEEGKFYYDPVLWAYYHDPQIAAGTSATTFSPNDGATRAQVVTFLWRAAGSPEPKTGTNPFEDVPDGTYFTEPVLWAAEEGIASGTSATTFSPNNTCTRGEFVTFLYRFAGSPSIGDVDNPFEDVDEGRFYYRPVLWAVEQKVTAGTSETTFSPKKICTRGEIVTFLYRYMGEE